MKTRRCQRLLESLLIGCCALLVSPLSASASPFDNKPKILLHAVSAAGAVGCGQSVIANCQSSAVSITAGAGSRWFAYLMAAPGNLVTLRGFAVGIEYGSGAPVGQGDRAGVDVLAWSACAPHQFQGNGWPAPGGDNILLWNVGDCRDESNAVAGYFYCSIYDADSMRLTPRHVDGFSIMSRCNDTEVHLGAEDLGVVAFSPDGTAHGCNPCLASCGATPVSPTTWSRLKLVVTLRS